VFTSSVAKDVFFSKLSLRATGEFYIGLLENFISAVSWQPGKHKRFNTSNNHGKSASTWQAAVIFEQMLAKLLF